MMQTIAIDWSGRERGAAEAIWFARVRDGALVELENGMERDEVIDTAIDAARREPQTVVGLDFAFAFPAWYSERRGWAGGRAIWDAMRDDAEALLKRASRRSGAGRGLAPKRSARRCARPRPTRPRHRRASSRSVGPARWGRDRCAACGTSPTSPTLDSRSGRSTIRACRWRWRSTRARSPGRSSRAAIAPGASTSRDAFRTRTRSCANARPAPRTRSTPRCRRS